MLIHAKRIKAVVTQLLEIFAPIFHLQNPMREPAFKAF